MLLVGLFTRIHHSNPCAHWAFKKNGGRVCIKSAGKRKHATICSNVNPLSNCSPCEHWKVTFSLSVKVTGLTKGPDWPLWFLKASIALTARAAETHTANPRVSRLLYTILQWLSTSLSTHFTETCCIAVYCCIKSTKWYCSVILLYL